MEGWVDRLSDLLCLPPSCFSKVAVDENHVHLPGNTTVVSGLTTSSGHRRHSESAAAEVCEPLSGLGLAWGMTRSVGLASKG